MYSKGWFGFFMFLGVLVRRGIKIQNRNAEILESYFGNKQTSNI